MTLNARIVAILRGITPQESVDQVACLLEHGIATVEITTNSPDWATSLARVHEAFGHAVQCGAGTVLTPAHVATCAQAGGQFILTPNLDARVVKAAQDYGLRVCAGVFTATEIFTACELGVDVLKVFPAGALPFNYPQIIKGPLSGEVHFSAVGGVEVENVADFLRHYDSVGVGSALYRPGQRVAATAEQCRKLLNAADFSRR
ncbi:2-dehydro-3-deoxyphosphogluconate aldolase [Superficieibacter sp.]|uniref:2-dehydro-3-deoxyphosphogluconate aldolase n=1 Tax=Superficieibacter sp. TaxID=2303322 RepID=UPI0028AF4250|nr:2-dehydro-3-deoxyphosphogluconate aldolase [Superficieibacter sp.]